MRLVLSRKLGEAVVMCGGRIRISVSDVRGDRVKLLFEAPSDVDINREEVWLELHSKVPDVSTGP